MFDIFLDKYFTNFCHTFDTTFINFHCSEKRHQSVPENSMESTTEPSIEKDSEEDGSAALVQKTLDTLSAMRRTISSDPPIPAARKALPPAKGRVVKIHNPKILYI